MESSQVTCPQCGLANNELAEACAQCGIIFVKINETPVSTEQDERKRKAIEEAEAILEQIDPALTNEPAGKETVVKPDPAEDNIEMVIPVEHQATKTPSEPAATVESQPEENQEPVANEIELEAIETSIEMVSTDAEKLFLSEVESSKASEPQESDSAKQPADLIPPPETAIEQGGQMVKSDVVAEEKKDEIKENTVLRPTNVEPAATIQPQDDPPKSEPAEAETEVVEPEKAGANEPAKVETPEAVIVEPASTEPQPAETAKPAEKEVPLEENTELTVVEGEPVQDTAQTNPGARIEMPQESPDEHLVELSQEIEVKDETKKKQQEAHVKEALQKQRENKAKAEALKKQKAAKAKAAALKKKKLAKVKAEALKKQKTAQAKAEAAKKNKAQAKPETEDKKKAARTEVLKKQKDALAKAEASTQDFQVAINGASETASQTTDAGFSNQTRLLRLLKKYKGKAIGINYDNSSEIKAAELVDANEEFFSVMVKDKKLQYSYPLKNILTIVEGQEGVETGEDDQKSKFDAVIKVYPLVAF